MKIQISDVFGGGLFSLFHQALETLLHHPQADTMSRFKIRMSDRHFIQNKDLLNDFFEDSPESCDTDMTHLEHHQRTIRFIKVHRHAEMARIKRICRINPLRLSSVQEVDRYAALFGINENSLAIHMRMTDMNTVHANDYGVVTREHYHTVIDQMLQSYPNIDNIYITSDNTESIHILQARYSDRYRITYVMDSYRREKEDSENCDFQRVAINALPDFHIRAFTELLIASRCSYFIYRLSDYSNFCLLYSDTINAVMDVN